MKPDEEMRADMEEQDLEPCDLFVDLGMLVVEGRIPGLTSRGYGEGPHCLPQSGGQSRHKCDPQDPQCIREENFRKHMMLLWRNNIPMSIEVLLCPDCCHGNGKQQGIESLAVPEPSYILLEQWTMQMLTKRIPDVAMNGKNLLQAVRSFLHFSQLSAWYSLSAGKSPQNVVYRICVPGEAFSNKFTGIPDVHTFPVANVGRNNAMKVSVRAMPRNSHIPNVHCRIHEKSVTSSKDSEANKLSMACALAPEEPSYLKDEVGSFDACKSRRDSPPETLLGESLLDPPQSLQMYPKRYQSPSRSGSPVMETPEHLMFGSCREGREAKYLKNSEPRSDRSRQRRPFIEKNYMRSQNFNKEVVETKMVHLKEKHLPSLQSAFNETSPNNSGNNGSFYFALTPKETEEILNVLRQRSTCRTSTNYSKLREKPESEVKPCNSQNASPVSTSKVTSSSLTQHDSDASKTLYDMHKPNIDAESDSEYCKCVSLKSSPTDDANRTSNIFQNSSDLCKRTCHGSLASSRTSTNSSSYHEPYTNKSKLNIIWTSNTPACNDEDGIIDKEKSDRTLTKSLKCSTTTNEDADLLQSCNTSDSYASSVEANNNINNGPKPTLLKQVLDRQIQTDSNFEADEKSSKIIPTATDKAKFRRSLDSATNMVFHSKTGLPLTSSPAPLRKGTCFDFDSSLTSITAIKNALFEKGENEIEELAKVLSTSAPATFTNNSLLGSFEECVLNGRLEPVSTVEGFTAEIGASGSFCPRHITMPVTVFFYTLSDADKVSTPYMGHINLGPKGYHVPKKGTVQLTLFNPHGTVVKMFVVMYDLEDMPFNCQTFLRQRTLYMPIGASDDDTEAQQWLRYLIHLRFASSKSGRIYLHTDIRMVIFRKSDMDAGTIMGTYELRSFTRGPTNPRFSPKP